MAEEKDIKKLMELMKQSISKNDVSSFDKNFKGMGVVLKTIKESDGYITPGEISKKTGLTAARVTVLLKKLSEKEYISKVQDEKDARKHYVRFTQKGIEFWDLKKKEFDGFLSEIIDDIGMEPFYRMFECIDIIHNSAKKIIKEHLSENNIKENTDD